MSLKVPFSDPKGHLSWMLIALSAAFSGAAEAQTPPAIPSPPASPAIPSSNNAPGGPTVGASTSASTSTTAAPSTSTTAAPSTSTTAAPSTSTTAAPSTSTTAAPSTSTTAPSSSGQSEHAEATAQAARLDEIEQLARISDRKHELLAEEAAKRIKETPIVKIDDKGFSLGLPDRSYTLKIRALVQADGRFFVDNDTLAASDTFLVRRFRPSIEGTLFSFADFKLVPEFSGTVQVLDGYVDLHPWDWLHLRVGKYKAPIGLERLQSDADRSFLEQSLVQNLSSQRDVGAALWGDIAGGLIHYTVGIFNGAADTTANDTDTNHAKDVQGRLFFRPFHGEAEEQFGNLGIGISAGTGNRKGKLPTAVAGSPVPTVAAVTGLSPFRTTGQNTFFQYLAPSTDTTGAATTFVHERATRVNPQLYYYLGGLGLLAEYVWLSQGVQKGNTTTELKQQAAAATLSYAFNGTSGFEGVTPKKIFDPAKGQIGAFEVAARVHWLKLDDATFGDPAAAGSVQYANPIASARAATAFGGALTWIPRRSLHVSASFERTEFQGGAGTTKEPADRPAENVIIARTQVAF